MNDYFRRLLLCVLLPGVLLCGEPDRSFAQDRLIVIGTGATNGVFYPIGVEICKEINKYTLKSGVRCVAAPTGGSEYNLMALRNGEADIAITLTYTAKDSFDGKGIFEPYGPDSNLRYIAKLYSTPVVIVAADKSFDSIDALKGKKISIGNRGGGKRVIASMMFRKMGWTDSDLKHAQQIDLVDQKLADEFCAGELDGFVQIMGMPSPMYDRVLTKCNGRILGIPQTVIDKLHAENSSLYGSTIPKGTYNAAGNDIRTLNVDTIMVASSKTPKENVLLVYQTLQNALPNLRNTIPALKECDLHRTNKESSIIPLHEALCR